MTTAEKVAELERAMQVWAASVKARGGQVTVFPANYPEAGRLAARYNDAGRLTYVPAPAAIQEAREALQDEELDDISAAAKLASIEKAFRSVSAWLKEAGEAAAALPRKAVGSILGVPTWLVTVLVIGFVGAYVWRASRK